MRFRPTPAWLVLAATACTAPAPTSNLGVAGLQQYVTLTPSLPTVGDSILVRSVVVNHGPADIQVEVPCDNALTFGGVLFVARLDTIPHACGVYDGPLPAGDSLVTQAYTPVITAAPGTYALAVHQLWSPGTGVSVRVSVTAKR